MKRIALYLLVGMFAFAACKKEEATPTEKSTKEKIIGKWMGDEQEISIVAPPPIGTQTQTMDLSYLNIEFKSDGTVTADSAGVSPETTTWALTANDDLILDSDTFDIMTLDASNFHFGLSESDTIGSVPVQSSFKIKLKK